MRYLRLLVLAVICVTMNAAFACSRVLYAEQGRAVIVGRTMDWYNDLQTGLLVFPRGIERDGLDKVKPLHWTSSYGSIVTASYDRVTTDGMNERGLAAHMLWLDATNYGKRDEKLSGLSVAMWAQYYLDNFQSVEEAIKYTKSNPFQILDYKFDQTNMAIHLALDDASGDSAILEYINGKLHIYHNSNYKVLTNDPVFNKQLANLKQYTGFGGTKQIPGTNTAPDRFVRGSYYITHSPQADSDEHALTYITSVIQNVAEPFTAQMPGQSEPEPTVWRVFADLTHHTYYFNGANSLNTVVMQLDRFNLKAGAPVLKLDILHKPELSGDVTDKFQPFN